MKLNTIILAAGLLAGSAGFYSCNEHKEDQRPLYSNPQEALETLMITPKISVDLENSFVGDRTDKQLVLLGDPHGYQHPEQLRQQRECNFETIEQAIITLEIDAVGLEGYSGEVIFPQQRNDISPYNELNQLVLREYQSMLKDLKDADPQKRAFGPEQIRILRHVATEVLNSYRSKVNEPVLSDYVRQLSGNIELFGLEKGDNYQIARHLLIHKYQDKALDVIAEFEKRTSSLSSSAGKDAFKESLKKWKVQLQSTTNVSKKYLKERGISPKSNVKPFIFYIRNEDWLRSVEEHPADTILLIGGTNHIPGLVKEFMEAGISVFTIEPEE